MTDQFGDEPSRLRFVLIGVLLAIVAAGAADLALDRPERLSFHVLFELAATTGALVIAVLLWRGWYRAERSLAVLRGSLRERGAERDAWRRSAHAALEGLAAAIDAQFGAWRLTAAEREVALLLLKGYSHKQVAHATGRSERTARQHAVAVYHKAGVEGRAELSAYFLDDLMLPEADREVVRIPG